MSVLGPARDEHILLVVARPMRRCAPAPVDEAIRRDSSSPVIEELDARVGEDSYALVEGLEVGEIWIADAGSPTREILEWAESRALELV